MKKLLIMVTLLILASCQQSEQEKTFQSLINSESSISAIDLKVHDYTYGEDEKPITKEKQIRKFVNYFDSKEIKKINYDTYRNLLDEKLKPHRQDKNSFSAFIVEESNSTSTMNFNGVLVELAKNGFCIITVLDENESEDYYKLQNKKPALFDEVQSFYKTHVTVQNKDELS
ncbi:hypothetical protein GLW08_03620 [Pontibacillus yanchengensis]|uniref:Uncharacterized protein n=2 Tax=Pontibacillus yanchengensis TaxID=462910 RepID=A0ACC7VE42_9BACI|nr:hypothetical protein [Pontibacillus yanchengensis]MYL35393.1 hypothetical protein [Pontibacillus yanchengensis]MYL52424.1 hypothetical protein [Pontibacillus yanchengensis]